MRQSKLGIPLLIRLGLKSDFFCDLNLHFERSLERSYFDNLGIKNKFLNDRIVFFFLLKK